MYWTIVVGWDDSEQARDALALARVLRAADGVVIAACVHPRPGPGGGRVRDRAVAESAEETLRGARAEVTEQWLDTRAVAGMSAAHGLHRLVEEEGADLVVVGSSRGGRERSGVGRNRGTATPQRVPLSRGRCARWIPRPGGPESECPRGGLRRQRGGRCSALREAATLARGAGGRDQAHHRRASARGLDRRLDLHPVPG